MTLAHPLITSLQTLVEQAQSVPQEEAHLVKLTGRLAQVADERARCVERLETGRSARLKLATAERYLDGLISGTLVLPQQVELSVEEAIPAPVDQPAEPMQAGRPRLEPRHWVSEERLRQARVARSILAPLPYNARMAMIQIPSRLYCQVRARTPAWDRRAREHSRQRAPEKREARKELAALPALNFLFSLGLGR